MIIFITNRNSLIMQVALSKVYFWGRIAHREGDHPTAFLTINRDTSSCFAFCTSVVKLGGLCDSTAPNTWDAIPSMQSVTQVTVPRHRTESDSLLLLRWAQPISILHSRKSRLLQTFLPVWVTLS